jgi:hypothetical protein
MPDSALANFIETQNIARFRALLETETDPEKRRVLLRLLEQERAKLDARRQARELDQIGMRCPEKYRR